MSSTTARAVKDDRSSRIQDKPTVPPCYPRFSAACPSAIEFDWAFPDHRRSTLAVSGASANRLKRPTGQAFVQVAIELLTKGRDSQVHSHVRTSP
jgi:hypothetical protein